MDESLVSLPSLAAIHWRMRYFADRAAEMASWTERAITQDHIDRKNIEMIEDGIVPCFAAALTAARNPGSRSPAVAAYNTIADAEWRMRYSGSALPVCDATINATILGYANTIDRALTFLNAHFAESGRYFDHAKVAHCLVKDNVEPRAVDAWIVCEQL